MSAAIEQGDAGVPPFEPPALNETQQRIVDSLREDGIAAFRYEELFSDPSLEELQADIAPFVEQTAEQVRDAPPVPEKKKDYIVRRYLNKEEGAPRPCLPLDSPWIRVAVSEAVLDVVNAYRGQPTKIHYVDNWYTVPYAGQDKRIASQRWHRDPEESNVVKMFLYLSDVDKEAGPFEYAKGSFTGGRHGGFFPWAEGEFRPPEEELYAAIPAEDRVTMEGTPGSMFLCDTGGFHRGGFARTKPRILATWSYVALTSGKGHRFDVDFGGREAELPAHVRTALL